MKEKLVMHEVKIEWWKLIPDFAFFLALNLYFVFIVNRVLIVLFLLLPVGIIRLYYSPRCIISQKTAALYRGKRTVRQLEKIIAAGILSQPGEQPYIFLCGVERQKIERYACARKKEDSNLLNKQGEWENALLFFISRQAKKNEKIILLSYSRRRLKKLISFLGVEIEEESVAAVLDSQRRYGVVLDIINGQIAD